MSEHEEQLLIAGCRRGEAWAQKKLYELHASVMMGVCLRYVKNYETAQDILQEGFIKVFTKIHTYAGSGSFGGWMRKVFVSTALEYLRQHQAEQKKVSLSDCEETLENISATDIERISADDILRCIQSLPEGYQTVFN
ncbi:MAG: sigma-70 family RNA polymerase sigma factor, partial [Bacteroidales bacterium]|nr:sigma-70 family RNA polymerase sigma factor [Bacteroidales bacterium]